MAHKSFGRYEIKEELGRGGMAIVYHAFDPHFDRDVALKILPREFLFDQTFRDRFKRETKAIASLEHSAITPVYDFGEEEEQPYFVMRYMPGGSLADRIDQGALPLAEIIFIIERIAGALDFAHAQQVIHRDIKPANILFDKAGAPYISDFGVVKLAEVTSHLTGGGIVGTPAYMAPEMAKEGGVTHLVDVYALGVTLFQMVTGELPYNAETPVGLLMAHATEPIPDTHLVRPDLPQAIQNVIERAMAKDPAERYQQAGQLAGDLSAAAAGMQVSHLESIPPTEYIPQQAATTPPYVPTIGVPEDEQYLSPTAPEIPTPLPAGHRTRPNWLLLAGSVVGIGLLAVIIIGIVALLNMNERQAGDTAPTPTVTTSHSQPMEKGESESTVIPTSTLTSSDTPTTITASTPTPANNPTTTPAPSLSPRQTAYTAAQAGVSSNDEWDPYLEEINGVEMALVPAGCFQMGDDESFWDRPRHDVCLEEPFWIDVYEVTNEQYGSSGYWSGENKPRESIDWFDASVHCESREARLPTEAEWEFAARGPDSLLYPWGNDFVSDNVVHPGNSGGQTWDIGSKIGGVSWVGAYDLSGNVWEWVNDWYEPYESGQQVNPQGPDSGEYRVVRGGSYNFIITYSITAAGRGGVSPVLTYDGVGFRCALSYQS